MDAISIREAVVRDSGQSNTRGVWSLDAAPPCRGAEHSLVSWHFEEQGGKQKHRMATPNRRMALKWYWPTYFSVMNFTDAFAGQKQPESLYPRTRRCLMKASEMKMAIWRYLDTECWRRVWMHPPTDGYPTMHSGGAKKSWFKQTRCAYSLFWVTLLQLWNNEHCDMNERALESGGVVCFRVSALKLVTCPGCTHLSAWYRLQPPSGSWTDHISGRTCSTGYTK